MTVGFLSTIAYPNFRHLATFRLLRSLAYGAVSDNSSLCSPTFHPLLLADAHRRCVIDSHCCRLEVGAARPTLPGACRHSLLVAFLLFFFLQLVLLFAYCCCKDQRRHNGCHHQRCAVGATAIVNVSAFSART